MGVKLIDYDGTIHNLFDLASKHVMLTESGDEVDGNCTVDDDNGRPVLR